MDRRIVKREEKDNKGRFSLFELEAKPNVDIDNLLIKKLADRSLLARIIWQPALMMESLRL